jgi:predicted nucleotidyltransferase
MRHQPTFPTTLHQEAANVVHGCFSDLACVDTVLVVNSCARGKAVPESDLDFAVLVKPGTAKRDIARYEAQWRSFSQTQPLLMEFLASHRFAQIHLDLIDGHYAPGEMEKGGAPDTFELEVGNHICYSAPMGSVGNYFDSLQAQWLPYYDETLRDQRLAMTRSACLYDLDHIPAYMERGLAFYAFDRLWTAFQKYLQALFIAHRTYPIAYNKWIKEQVVERLALSALYAKLPPILSVGDIESDAVNEQAKALRVLLDALPE